MKTAVESTAREERETPSQEIAQFSQNRGERTSTLYFGDDRELIVIEDNKRRVVSLAESVAWYRKKMENWPDSDTAILATSGNGWA